MTVFLHDESPRGEKKRYPAVMAEEWDESELRRRAGLAQALLAVSDPQKLLGTGNRLPAYEADGREIARASFRFESKEELGLAIFKIFQKHYGAKLRKFDTFALAEKLLQEFQRKV
jgi:hypothetical protein